MSFSREPVNAELWLRQRENISRNLLAVIYITECQELIIYHKTLLDHVFETRFVIQERSGTKPMTVSRKNTYGRLKMIRQKLRTGIISDDK